MGQEYLGTNCNIDGPGHRIELDTNLPKRETSDSRTVSLAPRLGNFATKEEFEKAFELHHYFPLVLERTHIGFGD